MEWLERVMQGSNRVCPWWLCRSFDNPVRRLFQKPELLLAPYLKPRMIAVDIGCGMGYFTLGMATLVGPGGRVVAVDLQQQMLDALEKRARKAGLADRILLHRCQPTSLGVEGPVDFTLAFWMAHEVPDKRRFFGEIWTILKPGGRLLLAEPTFHVTKRNFERTAAVCREAGFQLVEKPAIAISRAVLMTKG